MDALCDRRAEVGLQEVFGHREIRENMLEETVVGIVDREVGHGK